MKLIKILIKLEIQEKINKKHGIYREEIELALFEGNPVFFRTRKERYIAITLKNKYITIVFEYDKGIAEVVTAYLSSDWQIKLYKNRRLKR